MLTGEAGTQPGQADGSGRGPLTHMLEVSGHLRAAENPSSSPDKGE